MDAYLEAHREQDALNLVNQMVALDPENTAIPMGHRPLVYESMAQPDDAADAWQRVVELSPDDAEAWEHLGTWREEQEQLDEAIEAYQQGRCPAPRSPWPAFQSGRGAARRRAL